MQDKDSLIEKLAAANKLQAGGSAGAQQASKTAIPAPNPPAFLTKDSASSLFGLSKREGAPVAADSFSPAVPLPESTVLTVPAVSSNSTPPLIDMSGLLQSKPKDDLTSASEPKWAAMQVAPAPSHDDLLREIQKLEMLSDARDQASAFDLKPITPKAQYPDFHPEADAASSVPSELVMPVTTAPIPVMPTDTTPKPTTKSNWRSWLMPVAVAIAGIASISILPKSAEIPPVPPQVVQAKPAAAQKVVAPVIATAPSTMTVSGQVQAATQAAPQVTAEKPPENASIESQAVKTVGVLVASNVPSPVLSSDAVKASAAKAQVTKNSAPTAGAKQRAETAIAAARKTVSSKPVTHKSGRAGGADTHTGNVSAALDIPRIPVVAVAAPAAMAAPVVVPKPAIAKGPDQCVGLSGMAADQCRQCSSYSFVRRLSCEGQIRVKYCEGREGMTRECPTVIDK
jgi:hypothetical protein